jgi:hypothetical protein
MRTKSHYRVNTRAVRRRQDARPLPCRRDPINFRQPARTCVAQHSNDTRPTWSVTQNRRGRGLWTSKHGLTMRVITAFLRTNVEIGS